MGVIRMYRCGYNNYFSLLSSFFDSSIPMFIFKMFFLFLFMLFLCEI